MRGYRADRAFDGGRVLPDGALVLVDREAIVAVESASAAAPADCEVVDLPGATLLPGLIDAHVHLCGDSGPGALERLPEMSAGEVDGIIAASLRAHLEAGVTAVRDLGELSWAVADRHRRAAEGPTVVASGPPVTSPGGHCWFLGGVVGGEEADLRRAVWDRAEHAVDVVKVMVSGGQTTTGTDMLACQYTVEQLRVLVEEAHRVGLPVTAHAHPLEAVERCVAAGVDGIEHATGLTGEDPRVPPAVAASIAEAGTAVCPTIGLAQGIEPPPAVQAKWARLGLTPENRRERIAELYRAGVTLISGVDAGIAPPKRHGVLPESVILLTESGVPTTAALASATGAAARACGLGAHAGLPPEESFHGLRHHYASLLIRHGESVKTVQARLGHASASETLDTYSHLWPDSEERTREAVDEAWRGAVVPPVCPHEEAAQ